MSATRTDSTNESNNLDHLTLHISSEVLHNAKFVSEGSFGVVYRVPYDGVLYAAKDQQFDNDVYKVEYFQFSGVSATQ